MLEFVTKRFVYLHNNYKQQKRKAMKKFLNDLYRGYGYLDLVAERERLAKMKISIGLNKAQDLQLREVKKYIEAFES